MAKKAVMEGGSSYVAFGNLIDQWLGCKPWRAQALSTMLIPSMIINSYCGLISFLKLSYSLYHIYSLFDLVMLKWCISYPTLVLMKLIKVGALLWNDRTFFFIFFLLFYSIKIYHTT
jgi:hypothetical protein